MLDHFSFIIITNGKNNNKLRLQINSILKQDINNFEIVIVGDLQSYSPKGPYIKIINDKENAAKGSLGGLRNTACSYCKYENIVVSDDDMLFTLDWYKNLKNYSDDFDILTTRVKLPDGTRFWDYCCYMSPTRGHAMLNPEEKDDCLYMSGGQSWIMKKYVWDKVKWDEDILIYNSKHSSDGKHNEDTKFALRCRESGFKISHNHTVCVYHNDNTYTNVSRLMLKRNQDQFNLTKNSNSNIMVAKSMFNVRYYQQGRQADALDILRRIKDQETIDKIFGKDNLSGSNFTFDNTEYNELINVCS